MSAESTAERGQLCTFTVAQHYLGVPVARVQEVIRHREAAWAEMTKVCADLLSGISRSLKQNADWRMEMLDEGRKPVFRIRLIAETLN